MAAEPTRVRHDLTRWGEGPDAPPCGIRSLPESSPNPHRVTWRVNWSVTGHRAESGPSSTLLAEQHDRRQHTSQAIRCGHCASSHQVTLRPVSRLRPRPLCSVDRTHRTPSLTTTNIASSQCFSVKNTSPTSLTSPPLLKCANHKVYHLVHVC
jgi:ribosomal protein L34E